MASFLHGIKVKRFFIGFKEFSSLSESGFIPTIDEEGIVELFRNSSHLFQRVASFLQRIADCIDEEGVVEVLISFREWLHSYKKE